MNVGGFFFMISSIGKPKVSKRKSENTVINLFIKIQLLGILIYTVLFLLSSFGAMSADLGAKYDMIISLCTFSLSSFLTALFSGIKIREHGLPVGILYTLPLNTLVVSVSMFLSEFKADYRIILTAVLLILSAGIGGITGVNIRFRR